MLWSKQISLILENTNVILLFNSFSFPSMDELGENLVHVLDALDVQFCIGIGEGAGADILCRFAVRKIPKNH